MNNLNINEICYISSPIVQSKVLNGGVIISSN